MHMPRGGYFVSLVPINPPFFDEAGCCERHRPLGKPRSRHHYRRAHHHACDHRRRTSASDLAKCSQRPSRPVSS